MTTVVFYGDSLTALYRWSDLIEQGAAAAGSPIDVINTAKSSEPTSWGLANVQPDVLAYAPSVVVVEFCTNDAYLPNGVTLAQAAAQTTQLVQDIEATGAKVFLMTTNPVVGPLATTVPDLATYLQQYRTLAASLGAGLIDNAPDWAAYVAETGGGMIDGYHPSLQADVLYEVPGIMHALGLSFPVIDPGVAAAVPVAQMPVALLYGVLGMVPDYGGLAYWTAQAAAHGILAVADSFVATAQTLGAPTDPAQWVDWVFTHEIGRHATADDQALWAGHSASQVLIGVDAGPQALAHAALSWLAVF